MYKTGHGFGFLVVNKIFLGSDVRYLLRADHKLPKHPIDLVATFVANRMPSSTLKSICQRVIQRVLQVSPVI